MEDFFSVMDGRNVVLSARFSRDLWKQCGFLKCLVLYHCQILVWGGRWPPHSPPEEQLTALQIILRLLGTWFIDPNPTAKSGKEMVKISQNWSKNGQISLNSQKMSKRIQKLLELLSKSCSYQKTWDIPSKSYYWSLNLLGTRYPGATTICSSAYLHRFKSDFDVWWAKLLQPIKTI